MATAKKTTVPDTGMNRQSWCAQRLIGEVETWRHWVGDSAVNFIAELKKQASLKNMPDEDRNNLTAVATQLGELLGALKPLEKSIHRATGRRIQRARAGRGTRK